MMSVSPFMAVSAADCSFSLTSLNGWGLTAIDSLDTMYLMGLKPEFQRAKEHVRKLDIAGTVRAESPPSFPCTDAYLLSQAKFVPFFETTIRYLGGLLSAYVLTSDRVFLDKAEELGDALLPAFETQSGLPEFFVNPST